jgi:hypothetical protein
MRWFIKRFFRILFFPRVEWEKAAEERSLTKPFGFMVGSIIAAQTIRFLIVIIHGIPIAGTGSVAESGMNLGIDAFALIVIGVFNAAIIYAFAPVFSGKRDFQSSLGLVAYSLSPYYVATILQFSQSLRLISFAVSCYMFVLTWIGLPRMMHCPIEKRAAYFIVVLILTFLTYFIGILILTLFII